MDEVIDLVAELRIDNKTARMVDLRVFADALRLYHEASANVTSNGAICQHPRTGAPMENPYLKIQATQGAIIGRMQSIRCNRVLALLQDGPPPTAS